MKNEYEFFGVCTKVVATDTVNVILDLGFNIMHTTQMVLDEVWGSDMFSGTIDNAQAFEFVQSLLEEKPVFVVTMKDNISFNGYAAIIWIYDENGKMINANQLIINFLLEQKLANASEKTGT